MQLKLSDMSPLPLREQIVRRIREMVLSGELPEHFQLPSIRGLAREERVGAVTVQRAYEDLEREKMIYPRQGKGFFVAPIDRSDRKEQATRRVTEALRDPLNEARLMGLTDREILKLVRDSLASDLEEPGSTGKED
ncbi:MAG: GntR family transcriptional regulator [Candidatus Krumholzibacteriota bacterium]